ncbi:MAG TPA: metallophosphoesterase [Parapedobacter sp.]|uniref:metallophosphoesterase n=1 Tax=Parapedobacter sp. TaxID=1958893 RepID=UPI002C17FF4D|nr:metallophosphoesterase [Parapedobacter sp.]HWK56806.1 metallophosphoesterase [Parapedobacter sp.]
MLKYLFQVVGSLVFLMIVQCTGGSIDNDESFFFFQMSDTQFGFFNNNEDFIQETINFERAISEANRLKPKFVIVTGDLINIPGDTIQIAAYKAIADKLDPNIPLYNLPGNHELENQVTNELLADYRRQFGKDYYTFFHGKLMGIVLNSSLISDPSLVQDEADKQFEWLQEILLDAASHNFHIIVFQHHPLFLEEPDEDDQYFNIKREVRKRYLTLFKKYQVSHVFAGHLHRNAYGKDGELEMVVTGPVGRPLGDDPSGFRIIKYDSGHVSHQYYSLDSIPSTIR